MNFTFISSQSLADQQAIVCDVFATMAGIEIAPSEMHLPEDSPISSVLNYAEALEGTILIECSPDLAYLFTERLMSVDRPTYLDDNVADAMGELANMIGGNLKGLMPPETCLSAPRVLGTIQRRELLARTVTLTYTCFTSEVGHCQVSLLQPVATSLPAN